MPRTDVSDVRDSVQNAGATLSQSTKDIAATTLDAVRTQASVAGETLGTAVSTALDTAKERGRQAQQDALSAAQDRVEKSAKLARRARKQAAKKTSRKARQLSILAQEKAGRRPRRRKGRFAAIAGVALAAVAAAGVLSRRRKNADATLVEPTTPPTGIDDPTSTPSS